MNGDPKTWSVLFDAAVVAAVFGFLSKLAIEGWRGWSTRRSINTAILAEVRRLIDVINGHYRNWYRGLPRPGAEIHALVPFSYPIYETQSKNLGKMKPALAAKVVVFYGYVQFLNGVQGTHAHYVSKDRFAEFDKIYINAIMNFVRHIRTQFTDEFKKYGLHPLDLDQFEYDQNHDPIKPAGVAPDDSRH
jgi:hypothetical protein